MLLLLGKGSVGTLGARKICTFFNVYALPQAVGGGSLQNMKYTVMKLLICFNRAIMEQNSLHNFQVISNFYEKKRKICKF